MKRLILAMLLISPVAVADSFKVDWTITTERQSQYSDYGFKYSADGINCIVGELERLVPAGEKRHVTCMAGKETIASRDVRCDKQQVENFIDTGILYVGCKTR